jgi:hypothetical protein
MKRKSKQIEIDAEISKLSKDLKIIRKIYSTGGSIFNVFENIPIKLRLDKTVEKGRRVTTSYYPESHDIYFIEYYNIGEPGYPHGGVRVYNKSLDEYKTLYPESVIKHKNIEFYKKI